ncbi:Rho GTPase activator (Bem3), putative [Talaromyces stipitatus ATCC 10500]|uniref:Rho GTPase activator (Bem3), putative n=1 Tax=Talaromyces stipitatus (strain ATCC 10500 / CBS 375.48 / QM 6759 / NRRL 1006) TaxID=441959 RepID=B8M7E0_TALSN|nr:Rho GTPase activator (Bem3), putative [Talaromyces stipitatus ATCC 10500]EED20360.1 Rho GTPase activator (Bem3), putative [Talaromyces stipitatus ATCC 10500]
MDEDAVNGGHHMVGDAIRSSPSNDSPFSSPAQTPSNALHNRGPRMMPRTSSIDSAISSISSASHSHNSSIDLNSLKPSDINNIITAAGSAEAVILHLLKDRQHAIARNDQLWRLLEKQRALVLGLNNDLERAIKDKDRYRKKLKELQSQPPPLPSHSQQSLPLKEATSKDQKSNATIVMDVPPQQNSVGSPQDDSTPIEDSTESVPEPAPLSVSHSNKDVELEALENNVVLPTQSRGFPTGNANQFASGSQHTHGPPELPPPNRKPPPAPLNLSHMGRRSSPIDPHAFQNSDSEHEDVDRGRRRTREDDDKEREAAAFREQEARSRSKKQTSEPSSGEQASFPAAPGALPSSPRKIVAQSPSQMAGGQFVATESLAAIINAKELEPMPLADRRGMSPPSGLPLSPRPGDRPLGSPLPRQPREGTGMSFSPPMSPRGTVTPLPQSPRATKQPDLQAQKPSQSPEGPGYQIPSIDVSVKIDSPHSPYGFNKTIYQGLVSENYPGLLLPPNALPSIEVKVASSRLRPSRNSYVGGRPEEEPVFILSVFSRYDGAELWRVEKAILALPQLDQQVRQSCDFSGKLPDRAIFSGHSPAKIDARREALNLYFETLLDTPMTEPTALVICRFLSSDAIEPRDDETVLMKANGKSTPELVRGPDGRPRKEGYLTKRGKNFGGWKSRYFVLHGPELKYFEGPGGAHLGTIKIPNAQIGKQSQNGHNQSPSRADDDSDNQYRHAFLILEPKKKDTSALVRHVLCAESDAERDSWVDALLHYVEIPSSGDEKTKAKSSNSSTKHSATSNTKTRKYPAGNKKGHKGTESPDMDVQDSVQSFKYDDAVPAAPPVFGTKVDEGSRGSPTSNDHVISDAANAGNNNSKIISGPTNGVVIQDVGAWGNKAATSVKEKKRSIWGFRGHSSSDLAQGGESESHHKSSTERRGSVRPVFGMPLAEAVQYCGPRNIDADLPAVVYRCLEYLQAKNAASEEGIFRLSGSNVVIKALKERFNTEGDVDFLEGDHYYDVHAVASLFKQYLRELPTTVLTLELQSEFRRVPELDDHDRKIAALNALVHMLPKPNLTLLMAISQYLITIINNSDVNKMTVRNVGIVFAPTLNMPAPVFSLFLTEYDSIFTDAPHQLNHVEAQAAPASLIPEDVRSPRRQMFSELPTPSYGQTSFYVPDDADHHQSQDAIRANYDTGFIPMIPSYDGGQRGVDPRSRQSSNPHRMTRMLDPNENMRSTKAKRRESSMLFMDMGHYKNPLPRMGEDQNLVTHESAFE